MRSLCRSHSISKSVQFSSWHQDPCFSDSEIQLQVKLTLFFFKLMIELFNFRIATMHTIKTCDLAGHRPSSQAISKCALISRPQAESVLQRWLCNWNVHYLRGCKGVQMWPRYPGPWPPRAFMSPDKFRALGIQSRCSAKIERKKNKKTF